MIVRTTWTNNNPDTIWNRLAARLGREPTNAEAAAEVKRILAEPKVEISGARFRFSPAYVKAMGGPIEGKPEGGRS